MISPHGPATNRAASTAISPTPTLSVSISFTNPASYFDGAGLMIRRTPLDWLSAGCNGCVILDYAEFAHRLRALDIPECRLVGESVIHAREIKKALTPLPDNVRIFVPMPPTVGAS